MTSSFDAQSSSAANSIHGPSPIISSDTGKRFASGHRLASMYRLLMLLGGAVLLFTNVSCPDQCDNEFGFLQGSATPQVENPRAAPYAVGDNIWITASFPARQENGNESFLISEQGGFVTTELFRVGPDSSSLLSATPDFTFSASEGSILPATSSTNPAAVILQFNCPEGQCGFRQGFRPDTTGRFILRITGANIDEVAAPFRYCVPPTLAINTLEGGGNLPDESLNFPLQTDLVSSFFWPPVLADFQENVYYFTVE